MSSAILPQLQILLGQLQDLDLQDLDPSLRSRLSNPTAATTATQAEIYRIESRTGSQNDCAETETGSEPPLRVPTALGRAPLHSSSSPCIPVTSDTVSLSASVPPTGHTISEYSPASPCAPVASETVPPSASVSPTAHTASEHSPTTLPIHHFPWIEIEHEGVMPSESAFVKPGEPRQFGMPLTGILPLEPPLQLFQWPAGTISNLGKPELHSLVPAPAAPPPELGCYPQAPVYTLNPEPDFSYHRGYRYAAPFYTSQRQIEHQCMLEVQIPPNLRPSHFDLDTQSFCSDPIPGMVQLPMGIPIVHHVNGDPKCAITAVCGHTLKSLMQYEEGEKVQALIPRLMTLTWGIKETETQPGVPGIFELPGMQKNLRSKHVDLGKLTPGDGSFNLASTHSEGEGHGIFMPAVQTNTPEAAAIIKEVLQILHQLYRLIIPLCISRFEWDMLEFNNIENNVVAFGGLEPGHTSCQLNSSSAVNVVIHGILDH
ncbi:hypothetical protein B0H17DRAFT_406795 [Mycena rosella]|uniref:Uncharacterized protein n=1 Tax=Mycena rosella TaxID=1033263 RepID=A0AAD7DRU4_MYCRO|nr:hypothetical protein B0H17DRAFT_406795 [Mycena rosella]